MPYGRGLQSWDLRSATLTHTPNHRRHSRRVDFSPLTRTGGSAA